MINRVPRFGWLASALLVLGLLAATPARAFDIYMDIDGVPGDVVTKGYQDWILVAGVSDGIFRPNASATGATRRRGDAEVKDIEILKFLDVASVKLRESMLTGRVFSKVRIHLVNTFGDSVQTFFKVELDNVSLTSMESSFISTDVREEKLTMNAEELRWTYTNFDSKGKSKGDVDTSWKIEEGVF